MGHDRGFRAQRLNGANPISVTKISNPESAAPPPAPDSFWRRRVVLPLLAQLKQGATPERMALSVGVGTACSLLPFLGFTTVLNLGVGVWLKLNQPIMQVLNQLLGPLQLVMIVGYVRVGEVIWRAAPMPLSVGTLMKSFKDDPWVFLQRFGWTGVHAATAWLLSVPLIVGGIFYGLRPVLRKLAARAEKNRNAVGGSGSS